MKWKVEKTGSGERLKDVGGEAPIEFVHPIVVQGTATKTEKGRIDIREHKQKEPTLTVNVRRWSSIEGNEPLLPSILSGRMVKVTIELLD